MFPGISHVYYSERHCAALALIAWSVLLHQKYLLLVTIYFHKNYCRLDSDSTHNWSEVEVLKLAAGVESSTIHPIGKAIVEAAKALKCPNVKVYSSTTIINHQSIILWNQQYEILIALLDAVSN